MEHIYLDHAATSPVHPEVVNDMIPYFTQSFGNPSSIHFYGRETRKVLDEARAAVAKSIGAHRNEIIFTSGGTESDNLALFGVAEARRKEGRHIITTAVEHHAVLHAANELENRGYEVTYLPVDETGQISLDQLKQELRTDTILVSIMYGNNETGTIQPMKEIGNLLKGHSAYFHTDAVQAFGLTHILVNECHIDLMSASGHKINGPKGTGFLYVKEGIHFVPQAFGGEQERKRRAGTENVAGIAGLKKAVELMEEERDERNQKYSEWRSTMLRTFQNSGISYQYNGHPDAYLPHVLNVSFPDVKAEVMLVNLDLAGIAASSGSACTAGSVEPSHVLVAMFGKDERTKTAIRFSFGYGNTEETVEKAAIETAKIVKRMQK